MPVKATYHHWLVKTEPDTYSIDDLARDGKEPWTGVRNYQARNFMRAMQLGDLVLIYHSNANPSAIVGLAKVCRLAYPDFTAFDRKSPYYDAKSDPENPRWWMVDLAFVDKFKAPLSLAEVKADPRFVNLHLVTHSRLSVQPVSDAHFRQILDCCS